MGWSIGYDSTFDRFIGYGVPATCDHPECKQEIDRGLSYVCGSEPYGGEHGCGLYFCAEHLWMKGGVQLCERCLQNASIDWDVVSDAELVEPFDPKPDIPTWIQHQLKDESWAQWREENPGKIAAMRNAC
jgi:hypothetical protein